MNVVFFSKAFRSSDVADLIHKGHEIGAEGYDLCVRPGYAVGPDNVHILPQVVRQLRAEGLPVPMVSTPTDFLSPTDPRAEPYLRALQAADVHLLKLGYFHFDRCQDYWQQVDAVRRQLEGWAALGARYGVTICYHTHSGDCLGLNASSLAHLIHGFDSRHIGAYLDPGHLVLGGEPFAFAAAVAGEQLRIVGLKDSVYKTGEFVPAGEGDVRWDEVLGVLAERGFGGPLSVHAEYHRPSPGAFYRSLVDEIAFFKRHRDAVAPAAAAGRPTATA